MVIFLILLILFALILQQRIGYYALKTLHEELSVENVLVDPGEAVTMCISLENRSRLPILYLRVAVTLPEGSRILDGSGPDHEGVKSTRYAFACYLLPRQKLVSKVKIAFPKRGVWHIGGIYLAAGDLLGIKEDGETRNAYTLVVAAPAPARKLDTGKVIGGLMGEQSVRRWIHEDPILSAGYREYTGREPQRSIAWNRSLASGQMMVRSFDHTTERRVRILLLMQQDSSWDRQEEMFSMVRSLCDELEAQAIPYSFASNGVLYSFLSSQLERTENGLGVHHRNRIFDGLGRAGYGSRYAAELLIRKECRTADPVQGYLLVVDRVDERTRMLLRDLETRTETPVSLLAVPEEDVAEEEGGAYDKVG